MIQDVPGDGNCAAYAMAAIEVPRKTPSGRFLDRQGWMDQVKIHGRNLRDQAARYIINNPNDFLIPARFNSIYDSLNEADTIDVAHQEIPPRLKQLPQQRYDQIHALLTPNQNLTNANKIQLIIAYGEYIDHDKEYLDKPFFDAWALMNRKKIAVLQKDPNHEGRLKVSSVHSPNPDNKALFADENTTTYVYFENMHYQWINRNSPQFTTQIPQILNTHNFGCFNAKPNVMLLKGLQPGNHAHFAAALTNIKMRDRQFYDVLCKWTYETFEQFRHHHNGHFYGVPFDDHNFGERILDTQVERMHESADEINLTMLKNTFFTNLRAGLTDDELKFVQI